MDSRVETYKHIGEVRKRLLHCAKQLMDCADVHDASKLESPEVEKFDELTDKLKGLTYNSDEYKECLEQLKPALDHHYANNSHHPQYYEDGIRGMDLLDLIEMLCDWKAATLRHADGDINRSIEENKERFGYGDELKQIFINTLKRIEVQ